MLPCTLLTNTISSFSHVNLDEGGTRGVDFLVLLGVTVLVVVVLVDTAFGASVLLVVVLDAAVLSLRIDLSASSRQRMPTSMNSLEAELNSCVNHMYLKHGYLLK